MDDLACAGPSLVAPFAVTQIAHFYHIYADGNWAPMVHEHATALTRYGLLDALDCFGVGLVGTPENRAIVRATLDDLVPGYEVVAEEPWGWEQETLDPLWDWCQGNDGFVGYGHTKGASRNDPIDLVWRRGMTYHCFVNWQHVVNCLEGGASIVGCHWHRGGPSSRGPDYGYGGMFGGNFWWTKAELLRKSPRPGRDSRHYAEHWLGQLSEVTPLMEGSTLIDLNPSAIGTGTPEW